MDKFELEKLQDAKVRFLKENIHIFLIIGTKIQNKTHNTSKFKVCFTKNNMLNYKALLDRS